MTRRSPHEILGVTIDASIDEITIAYKKMVQLYHPDKVTHLAPEFRELAETRIKEINAAYEELKSPNRKSAYTNDHGLNKKPRGSTLDSFFTFVGITYGDLMNKAHRVFGNPHEISDELKYSFITQYYFFNEEYIESGATLSYDRKTGIITVIQISTADAIFRLRSKGIHDGKLSYFRQHISTIIQDFGQPNSSNSGFYSYDLYVPVGMASLNKSKVNKCDGTATFFCASFNGDNCSDISVHWFL